MTTNLKQDCLRLVGYLRVSTEDKGHGAAGGAVVIFDGPESYDYEIPEPEPLLGAM